MTRQTLALTEPLYEYLLAHSLREPAILQQLRAETAQHLQARMQIAPEQGQFMALLVQLMGATRTLEVGTFTGYSALAIALALPEAGEVVTCDINANDTAIAQRYWQQAGVAHRIKLHLAPALETLNSLLAQGQAETFDFAFIDADKGNYLNYFELALKLVRPGGLIAVDNTLWSGRVADPNEQSNTTNSIRNFNAALHQDTRVTLSLVPIGDGVTLARKRWSQTGLRRSHD